MIYSSGRESFFNLNSTWYDPSGSWLDTRRTPFRYGYANCCSSGCHGEGAQGMRGHDYRHYGYRQPVCSERCQGYGSSGSCHGYGSSGSCHGCVRRPSYGYGSLGGCQGYGGSVCSERCHGSSGQGYGGSVCSERCHGSSGGAQGYGGSACSERCHGSGYQGGKAGYGKVSQWIPQSAPKCAPKCIPQSAPKCAPKCIPQSAPKCAPKCVPVQVCPPPVQVCPPPVQVCPPQAQQGCVPVPKGIPSQQQKQVCQIPARKMMK